MNETHRMEETGALDGYTFWACPLCGRVIHLRFEPFDLLVQREGDPNVAHTGGVGVELTVQNVQR